MTNQHIPNGQLDAIDHALHAISNADALLVGAGAGMGVDSGLPDYRGSLGFWRAGDVNFEELSTGQWFIEDPAAAWGFFLSKQRLFERAIPHSGYDALRSIAGRMSRGSFIFSSNIDGHFERAGFSNASLLECHGSGAYLQCSRMCTRDVWPAPQLDMRIDPTTLRLQAPPPACPRCGHPARPNVLLFGDNMWTCSRHAEQNKRYRAWRDMTRGADLVIIEVGAGTVIPTVREQCEAIASERDAPHIRVNPAEADHSAHTITLKMGACAGLTLLDKLLRTRAQG